MEALQKYIEKYIEKYTINIPSYVENSNKSIYTAIEKNDINLVKSLIAYNNYLNRMEKEVDILDELFKLN